MKTTLFVSLCLFVQTTYASMVYQSQNRFVRTFSNAPIQEDYVIAPDFTDFNESIVGGTAQQTSSLHSNGFEVYGFTKGKLSGAYQESVSTFQVTFDIVQPTPFILDADLVTGQSIGNFGHVLFYNTNVISSNQYMVKEYRGDRPDFNFEPLDLHLEDTLEPGTYYFESEIHGGEWITTMDIKFFSAPEPAILILYGLSLPFLLVWRKRQYV